MIVTPAQLTHRAEFYYQLGQLTNAGLGVVRALEQLSRNPPSRAYRGRIDRAARDLTAGSTLSEALSRQKGWLPELDLTVIQAGERSGRLDQTFKLMAEYYSERARIAKQAIVDLAYPVFLFHFFVFIMGFPKWFMSGDLVTYLRSILVILVPVYVVTFVFIYAMQSKHAEWWRSLVESLLHPVPMLGSGRRSLAIARLSIALESQISAGVNIIEAWELAAAASGSPSLRRTVINWRPLLASGETPGELLNQSRKFPELFRNQYMSGEISGKLEETLKRLHTYYQEEGSRKIRVVSRWVPIAIYLLVAFLIARYVIGFYVGHFREAFDASHF